MTKRGYSSLSDHESYRVETYMVAKIVRSCEFVIGQSSGLRVIMWTNFIQTCVGYCLSLFDKMHGQVFHLNWAVVTNLHSLNAHDVM